MKNLITIAALVCVNIYHLAAQTNNAITVFTEGGERFYLILNGIKQNETAQTNVKGTALNGMQFKAKVIFEQKGIPDCDKSIPMMWAGEQVSNTEFVFSVHKDKKGVYKWKFVSQAPVGTAVNTNTIVTTGNASNNETNMNVNTNVSGNVGGTNANNTVTSTTTTTNGTAGNTGVNMNIGINGVGLNMNVNVNDGMGGNVNSVTTTTTTTTYSTSSTTNGVTTNSSGSNTQVNTGTNPNSGNVGINVNMTGTGMNTNTNTNYTNTDNNITNATNTGSKCGYPMSSADFGDAKTSIEAKSFEDTKLSMAKQIADNNCLDVNEIKGIMQLFSFEASKLDFAKYCYAGCYDKRNYFKLNDAFEFDASTTELNEYVKGK